MNLAGRLTLDNTQFRQGLSGAQSSLGGFLGSVKSVMAPLAAVGAAFGGIAAVVHLFKRSITEAANMEDAQVGFATLLGSAAKAKQRIEELSRFEAKTPYKLPEILEASKLLQAFTGDVLASGKGLTLVGDAAAAVNKPLQEVSMWFGRLFAGMTTGQALGEPLQNLTQLGLVTAEVRNQLLAVQGQTLSSAQAFAVLENAFGGNAGAMERLARTLNGLLSTLQSTVQRLYAEFGAPIVDALKPVIKEITALMESLIPVAKQAGEAIAAAIDATRQAVVEGRTGELVGGALKVGFASALDYLRRGLNAAMIGMVEFLSQPAVWQGVGRAAAAATKAVAAGLGTDAAKVLFPAYGLGDWAIKRARGGGEAAADDFAGAIVAAGQAAQRAFEQNGPSEDLRRMQAEFAALASGLAETARQARQVREAAVGTGAPPPPPPSGEGAAAPTARNGGARGPDLDGDRLARIGGFIGGAGGPALQHLRQTSENTRRTFETCKEILNAIESRRYAAPSWG